MEIRPNRFFNLNRGLFFSSFLEATAVVNYTLRRWKLRNLRVKKCSVSFTSGRREFRFPTVAIRRSRDLYGSSIALIIHSFDRSLFSHLILQGAIPRSRASSNEIIVSLYALLFKRNGIIPFL